MIFASLSAALLWASTLTLHERTAHAQADNEIQVYASPTIGKRRMIVELHSNHTFRGVTTLTDPDDARWTNETLEITYGVASDVELGFYTFTAISPDGGYQYLGNQIRPRVTAPGSWAWPVGVSLSFEFGFFRPDQDSDFLWQGEVRPIVDWTGGNLYLAFNPNLDLVMSGAGKGVGLTPQAKAVYAMAQVLGVGFEYYADLGSVTGVQPLDEQEHLVGPMLDLYAHPDWEVNAGFLFGLTDASNQHILKILLGKRFGL